MEEIKTRKGFCYYIAADSDPEKRMYIGSSIQTQLERKAGHRHAKGKKVTAAAQIIQFVDWGLHVIEWYELEGTKEEAIADLRQYEQRWIEILRQDCVNKINASGQDKQKYKAYQKIWRESEEGKISIRRAEKKYKASERGKATGKAT